MPFSKSNSKQSVRGRRNTRRPVRAKQGSDLDFKKIATIAFTVLVPTAVFASIGYHAIKGSDYIAMNPDTFCYEELSSKHTAFVVEYSTTKLFAEKSHFLGLKTAAEKSYKAMPANGRLDVFSTAKETTSDIIKPVLSICRPPKDLVEFNALNSGSATLADKSAPRLKTQYGDAIVSFNKGFDRIVEDSKPDKSTSLLDPLRERWNAPILETLVSISRFYDGIKLDHMALFSAGIQWSEKVQFCGRQGDLPKFSNFIKRDYWAEFKPYDSFRDAKVTFLLLETVERYPQGPFCEQKEANLYWRDYFKHAGAEIDIVPLNFRIEVSALASFDYYTAMMLAGFAIYSWSRADNWG